MTDPHLYRQQTLESYKKLLSGGVLHCRQCLSFMLTIASRPHVPPFSGELPPVQSCPQGFCAYDPSLPWICKERYELVPLPASWSRCHTCLCFASVRFFGIPLGISTTIRGPTCYLQICFHRSLFVVASEGVKLHFLVGY